MQRTRRLAGGVLGALALSALLVGCGHRDPSHYGGTVEHNFVQGCQVVLAGGTDNANESAVSAAINKDPQQQAHSATCGCVYKAVSAHDGIPFKDFKSLQDQVRNQKSLAQLASTSSDPDIKKYANQLRDIYNRCAGSTPTTALPNGGGVSSAK